ncbi:MAG: site-specific DNA-methyltransferase [Candidatus Gastranaerophilales bacterium]|nr:site-specific DNA-methyltransferase [Candidatus Gastranaerophilales bacterium]
MDNNDLDKICFGDSIQLLKKIETESIHMILSDIPYGIGAEDWDVLHDNTNSAYLGTSPAQEKAGAIFKKRGKPLNGWSEADKEIPKQYYEWCCSWVNDWFRVLKPGASVFVFAGRRLAHRCICAFEDAGFTYKDMIAWNKEKAPYRAQRISKVFERRHDEINSKKWENWRVGNLRPVFEPILWFVKPYKIGGTIADNMIEHQLGAFNEIDFNKYTHSTDNIISVKSTSEDIGLHPTQKPVKLMKILIELTTTENQTVLDPFCGSGTALLAAKILKRHFIGFEKELKYYNVAKSRIEEIDNNNQISLFAFSSKI